MKPLPLLSLFALVLGPIASSQTISVVGVDEETNDGWRTNDLVKPFTDADNIYGTDGYLVAQGDNSGDAANIKLPVYATFAPPGLGYEGTAAWNDGNQSSMDLAEPPGAAPVPDGPAGDWWTGGGGPDNVVTIFSFTVTENVRFRLGVIADQTPPKLIGPGDLVYESAKAVQVARVTGGAEDSGLVDVLGPGEAWKDGDVDYVLFDITANAGDVFEIRGQNDDRWPDVALGGFFFDPVPNPNAPQIASFTATPNETDTPGAAIQFDWEVEVPLDALVLNPGNIDVLGDTDLGTGVGGTTLDPGPDQSTVYSLEATRGGETGVAQVRVTLLPPEIESFTADPNVIPPAAAVTLSWQVAPPFNSLTLQPGDIDVLPDTDALGVGSITFDSGPSESTTYELVAVRGANATTTANAGVIVQIPGTGVTLIGVDETTNDAWRSSDIEKPFGDADNIYGTDGYLIAQFAGGDPQNLVNPPYASIELVAGRMYEGLPDAHPHQAVFDDVLLTGPGDIPDLICGDYWSASGPTGQEDEFFTITLSEDASFRLGIIGDQTPDNPPGLLWEASVAVRITGSNGADSGLIDLMGPNEEWRDADVDYVLVDLSGKAGDVFTIWGVNDARWSANALGGVFFDPAGGPSGPRFSVEQSGNELLLKWDSQGGKLYNLRSEVSGATPPDPGGIANDPSEWPVFGGFENIAATPPENTLTIPYPADPARLFVIEEFNAPPETVFADDFEAGQGGWSTGSDGDPGTLWQLGTPGGGFGPLAANSGTNCFGTNLDGEYAIGANVWLRSPPIDLTGAGAATLNYAHFTDIEVMFDSGTVSVLDATDDSLIEEIATDIDGVTSQWDPGSHPLPASALGKAIRIEFRLQSDSFGPGAGWYIDDVEVTVP